MDKAILNSYDVHDTHANCYIEDELVCQISLNLNNSYQSAIKNIGLGHKAVYVDDFTKIPTIGMIYDGHCFLSGKNGEDFLKSIPGYILLDGTVAVVSIDECNVVSGIYSVYLNVGGKTNPYVEEYIAILLSDPKIIFSKFDPDPDLIKQIGKECYWASENEILEKIKEIKYE